MRFSIILPTFKNSNGLKHTVLSLQSQTYTNWELIIVNDSPKDYTYKDFSSNINDPRIHYHVNESMRGDNYSKNLALEKISSDSKWVIFLDDSCYFSPDTLATLSNLILMHPEQKWFATNIAKKNGESFTVFPKDESLYSYPLRVLLCGKSEMPITHCIESKLIIHTKSHFSRYIKNGESWFFFYQVSKHSRLLYCDHNSTIQNVSNATLERENSLGYFETLMQTIYELLENKIFTPLIIPFFFFKSIHYVFQKK